MRAKWRAYLDAELEASSSISAAPSSASMYKPLTGTWSGMVWPTRSASGASNRARGFEEQRANVEPETGVALDVLRKVGIASVATPDGFVSGRLTVSFSSEGYCIFVPLMSGSPPTAQASRQFASQVIRSLRIKRGASVVWRRERGGGYRLGDC